MHTKLSPFSPHTPLSPYPDGPSKRPVQTLEADFGLLAKNLQKR